MPPLLKKWFPIGVVLAGAVLSGCAPTSIAQYFTNQDVALLSGQGEDSSVVAWLPRGTPLIPAGQVNSHGMPNWKVETPMGTGWVFTRFIDMRLADSGLQP
jgi:hypothetical protein